MRDNCTLSLLQNKQSLGGRLVRLDGSVDPPHKCVSRQEPDCTREKPVHRAGQQGVGKEEQCRHEPVHMQSRTEKVCRVGKHPDGRATADKERLPPPMIILLCVSVSTRGNVRLVGCLTSAHNWKYTATTVTSMMTATHMILTTVRKPNM